ncbi:MAG: hypothetical protein R3215_02190 [Halomonas sp.]|nr:hypothetical protein [Halomonas sp.]
MATIAGLVVEISARSQKFQKAMQGAQKRVDTLRRVTKEHSKRIEKSLRGAFESAASSVRGFAKKAASRLSTFAKQARGIATQIGKWVAAGLTAAAAAVTAVVTTTSLAMRDLIRDSKAVGVAASDLQTWQYAARSMGVEGDKVQDIFKDLADKTGDFARTGGGEAADIFEQLGISAQELLGLSPDKALLRINSALEGLSQGEKIFFMESIADDASRLLPLLDDNARGLKAMSEQGRNWGAIMTQAEIQASAALGNTLTDAKNMVGGFKQLLGAQLAPAFQTVISWVQKLTESFGGPREAARTAAAAIVSAMANAVDGVSTLFKWVNDVYDVLLKIQRFQFSVEAVAEQARLNPTQGYGRMSGYGADNPPPETGPATARVNELDKLIRERESLDGGSKTAEALRELADSLRKNRGDILTNPDTLMPTNEQAGTTAGARTVSQALEDQVDATEDSTTAIKDFTDAAVSGAKSIAAATGSGGRGALGTIAGMVPDETIAGTTRKTGMLSVRQRIEAGKDLSAYALEPNPSAKSTYGTALRMYDAAGSTASAASRGLEGGARMGGGKNLGTLTLKNDKGESQDFFTENTEAAEKWLANTLSGAASSV